LALICQSADMSNSNTALKFSSMLCMVGYHTNFGSSVSNGMGRIVKTEKGTQPVNDLN